VIVSVLTLQYLSASQFEPEAFVDGLLGIGKAGGKSLANEGALLDKRLKELRKDRDQQAVKTKKVAPAKAMATAAAATPSASAAGELTFQEMDASPPTQGNGGGSQKPNRKKKRKKKGRR